MEYEDIDNNENIAYYFGDLSIDIYNDYRLEPESFYTKLEQFYTFFNKLKGLESIRVVNILANNTFKYYITLSEKTISFITPAPYVFNSSTNLQYNDTKFKRLFIDLGTST